MNRARPLLVPGRVMVHAGARIARSSSAALFAVVTFYSIGCGVNPASVLAPASTPAVRQIQGSVYGGQQPVVGAAIQIYAVGAPSSGGGYGQGATALITGTLPVTDANGSFNLTGAYTAPSAPSFFYIVASGGSPGVSNPANSAIVLMAAVGACTPSVGLSPSLFVSINEVTTMATVLALQPFMAAPASGNVGAPLIGAPSTAYNALQNAFETMNNLANPSTGSVVLPAADWATTTANGLRINTMADILASCVNSTPSGPCNTLFADATPSGAPFTAADTVQAAFYIAQNPSTNVSTLFNLVPPSPPFVGLSSAPADFGFTVATAASACQTAPALATAANFEVLAGSTITNAGSSTVSGGDMGLTPGTSVTGFPPGTLTSPAAMHVGDAAAVQAQTDLGNAYSATSALGGAAMLPQDISGLTLTPGLYMTSTTAQMSSNVTLDAQGDPNAVFIFKIGTTLTTIGAPNVVLVNGAQASHVFWQIGTSATLDTNTIFRGTIMASTSISLNTGVSVQGRVLAQNGAVTLLTNTITAP